MSLTTTATALSILIVVAIILFGCVLPIVIIWLIIRQKKNEADQRTQLAMVALEKNPDMDIEELLKKTAPKPKLLKEKLLKKLTWSILTGLLALVLIGLGTWMGYVGGSNPDDLVFLAFWGCILLAVSISCFISYFVGKKMLAKEIEAEEKQLTTQA